MKVIDILNKIANGEEVPKKIGVYDDIFVLDEGNYLYINEISKIELFGIYNGNILNYEVKIIEEDKIEKIDIGDRVLGFDDSKQDIYIGKNPENEAFAIKINEIIDYLNKENK